MVIAVIFVDGDVLVPVFMMFFVMIIASSPSYRRKLIKRKTPSLASNIASPAASRTRVTCIYTGFFLLCPCRKFPNLPTSRGWFCHCSCFLLFVIGVVAPWCKSSCSYCLHEYCILFVCLLSFLRGVLLVM